MSKADIKLLDQEIQLTGEKIRADCLATGEAGAEMDRMTGPGLLVPQGPARYDLHAKRAWVHDELRITSVGNQDFGTGLSSSEPSVVIDSQGHVKASKSVATHVLELTGWYVVETEVPGRTTEFGSTTTAERIESTYKLVCDSHGGARLVTTDDPAVLRLHSAPDHGFGASRLEFWSDPSKNDRMWRPGYITSHDHGGYTGCLKLFVNGSGKEQKEGELQVMSMSKGYVMASVGAFMLDRREHPSVSKPRRALVHGDDDELVINRERDYPGGVQVDGSLVIKPVADESVPIPGKPHYSLTLEHDAIIVTEQRGAARGQPASTTKLDLVAEVRALRAEVTRLKEEVAKLRLQ